MGHPIVYNGMCNVGNLYIGIYKNPNVEIPYIVTSHSLQWDIPYLGSNIYTLGTKGVYKNVYTLDHIWYIYKKYHVGVDKGVVIWYTS